MRRAIGIAIILAVGLPIAAVAGTAWYLQRCSLNPFNQKFF